MSKNKKAIDKLKNESSPSDDDIRQIRHLESERDRLKTDLSIEKTKREQAESDLKLSERRSAVLSSTDGMVDPKSIRKASRKPSGSATAILCCKDWHAEEVVDPETVNGLNAFDLDIADKRLEKLWDRFVYLLEVARQSANIRDAVLWLGGDLITGYIHEELVEGNMCSPTEAVLWIQDHVSTGINHILKHTDLKDIQVVTSIGNHGRTTKKSRIATAYANSYEWMAYKQLEKWFAGEPRLRWHVSKSYHSLIDVQGWRVRFHHGDGMRFWGGVGGLSIPVNKSLAQWNKSELLRADYDIFGHFHQFIQQWKWVSCGCLIGMSAFAIRIKADFQPPTQTFIVIDKERGKTMALPVFVT